MFGGGLDLLSPRPPEPPPSPRPRRGALATTKGETSSSLGLWFRQGNPEGFTAGLVLPSDYATGTLAPAAKWLDREGCQCGIGLSP